MKVLAFAGVALALAFSFGNLWKVQQAAADQTAPVIYIQYGDGRNTGPSLPGDCYHQVAGEGTSTTDGNDPDCLRVRIANPDTYTQDFQFCLWYNGQQSCSRWASESQGYPASINGTISGNHGGNLAGTMSVQVNTRPVTDSGLPAGTTFSGVSAGVALAYQRDYNGCGSSSGVALSPANSASPSGWAYGAQRDNDPGCFGAYLQVGSVNIPPDANYISTTIPTAQLATSTAYNNNYNIVFENRGVQWNADKTVRPLDGHCVSQDEGGPFDYSTGATCNDYQILSSDRYRLIRLGNVGSSGVQVRSQQLRSNSNDVTYNGSSYVYSGPATTIPENTSPASATPDNTIPFFIRQNVAFHEETYTEEICEPGGGENPGGGPYQPPVVNNTGALQKIAGSILNFLVPTAQARPIDPGDTCHYVTTTIIVANYTPPYSSVHFGQQGQFAPVNITTPSTGGTYTLQFKLVDLQSHTVFGQPGNIPVNVQGQPIPLDATMTATSPVSAGQSTHLVWGSTNADSCRQFVQAPGAPSYTELTGAPYGSTSGASDYSIAQIGTYSFLNQCVSATATPPQRDAVATVISNSVNLDATITSPANINNLGTANVSWDSPNPAPGTTCQQWYVTPSSQTVQIGTSLHSSFVTNPLPGPGDYTFYNQCTNSNASPTQRTATSVTHVAAPSPLDCSLTANPASPIPYNTSTTLTWSAPNSQTTQIYREQTLNAGDWVPISGATGNSGSVQSALLTSTTRYLCQANATNTTPTQVNTIITIQVQAALPLDAWLTRTSPVNVGQNTNLVWGSTNAATCQVYWEDGFDTGEWVPINGANTVNGDISYGPFNAAGSYRFLGYCENPNTTPTSASAIVTVVVNNVVAPNPPQRVNIDVSVCEQATITWQRPRGLQTVTGYYVYRSTDGSTWQRITGSPLDPSTFSYVDHPPIGNYYYAVTALNGAAESAKASAGPANVRACVVDLSTSDKDITAASPNNITSTVIPCNAVSDPVTLQGGKSFKVNDIVTFRINICNTGDRAATAVQVTDTLSNLSNPGNFTYSGCASGSATIAKGGAINITVGDVAPSSTCSISFTATVTKPASGSIYRFQNIGDIKPSNFPNKRVITPAYLFTDVSGNPDRQEIAP